MATYVIGDLQGHLAPLLRLLGRVGFDAGQDRLWFVGDLVNRGPESLETLRFIHAHRARVRVSLGNHDIHALACWAGVRAMRPGDTLGALLEAPDAGELFAWLRAQPIAQEADGVLMVHAGVPPRWDAETLRREAELVRVALSGEGWRAFLRDYFDGPRPRWSETLAPGLRAAATLRLVTRLRAVDAAGEPVEGAAGPEALPEGAMPWFAHPERPRDWRRIVFGHWAALGLWLEGDIAALDSGYVWGGGLTALRLEDGAVFGVPSAR